MATTAGAVFEITMALIDELRERDGAACNADTVDYKNRTLSILTALGGELYPYSDTFEPQSGRRAAFSAPGDFGDELALDDFLCRSVLPYGLAAALLFDENPGAAAMFRQRFDALTARYGSGVPAVSEAISDLYDGAALAEGGE
jgi:hypothetical protein